MPTSSKRTATQASQSNLPQTGWDVQIRGKGPEDSPGVDTSQWRYHSGFPLTKAGWLAAKEEQRALRAFMGSENVRIRAARRAGIVEKVERMTSLTQIKQRNIKRFSDSKLQKELAFAKGFNDDSPEALEWLKLLEAENKARGGSVERMAAPATKPLYEVIVGNIGMTHNGNSIVSARKDYNAYVAMSKSGRGRAAGERVTLLKNGEIIQEYDDATEEPTTRTYRWINYECWGNDKDGYEVNDAHTTSYTIELPLDNDACTATVILKALRDAGVFNKSATTRTVEVEWQDGNDGQNPQWELTQKKNTLYLGRIQLDEGMPGSR